MLKAQRTRVTLMLQLKALLNLLIHSLIVLIVSDQCTLIAIHRTFSYRITDKSSIAYNDYKSGHDDHHDHRPAYRNIEDRQSSCVDFDLNILPMLSSGTPTRHVNGSNDIVTAMPYQTIE
jgi:hypothetical protein